MAVVDTMSIDASRDYCTISEEDKVPIPMAAIKGMLFGKCQELSIWDPKTILTLEQEEEIVRVEIVIFLQRL